MVQRSTEVSSCKTGRSTLGTGAATGPGGGSHAGMHLPVNVSNVLKQMAEGSNGAQRTDPLSPRIMTFKRVLLRLAMPRYDRVWLALADALLGKWW